MIATAREVGVPVARAFPSLPDMEDISSIGQEEIPSLPFLRDWQENAPVNDRPAPLADRLRALIARSGKTPRALSLAIGANASYVGQVLHGRGGTPSAEKLRLLAAELGTTTTYLLGETTVEGQPTSEVEITDMPQWRASAGQRLPVYGTGYCDDLQVEADGNLYHIEQTMFEPTHVVQMIERPAALRDAKDAYAIYFHGSSMEPRFFQGEIALVMPTTPGPGDFVVVQLNDGNGDDVVHVLVKRLVRVTASYVELEQYNPPIVFKVERRRVTRMHRIVSPNQLLAR